jgi:DNA-binding CsgD family transcriptional regulator
MNCPARHERRLPLMPDENTYARLTGGQRICLRLVAQGYSSKEIARRTRLSPQTVDQYLSKAMALLDASSRREAARIFRTYEQIKKAEFKPRDVAEVMDWDMIGSSPTDEGWSATGSSMHERAGRDRSVGGGDGFAKSKRRFFPPIGGETNDLKPVQSIYAILRIAVFSAIVMVAIVAILAGALSLFD